MKKYLTSILAATFLLTSNGICNALEQTEERPPAFEDNDGNLPPPALEENGDEMRRHPPRPHHKPFKHGKEGTEFSDDDRMMPPPHHHKHGRKHSQQNDIDRFSGNEEFSDGDRMMPFPPPSHERRKSRMFHNNFDESSAKGNFSDDDGAMPPPPPRPRKYKGKHIKHSDADSSSENAAFSTQEGEGVNEKKKTSKQ